MLTSRFCSRKGWAIAVQVRALEAGIEPDVVRARIDELKAEKAPSQASLPKLGLAPERQGPAAVHDQVPHLTGRLRDADDATDSSASTALRQNYRLAG